MQIVTGYTGQAHVTADDIASYNRGTVGNGDYILDVGQKFFATKISDNEVQIADGEGVMQGIHFRVSPGTYDTVTVENGQQGAMRIDYVAARYTKDVTTGRETVEWAVLKGVPSSSNPQPPTPETGDIRSGATVVEFPILEVLINGVGINMVSYAGDYVEWLKSTGDIATTLESTRDWYVCGRGQITEISSDYDVLRLAPGAYAVSLNASSSYMPYQWGTLIRFDSGYAYIGVLFIATNGKVYARHGLKNSVEERWHTQWITLS